MDSANKSQNKNQNTSQCVSYSPWSLLFNPRKRTESETSVASNNSQMTSESTFVKLLLSWASVSL